MWKSVLAGATALAIAGGSFVFAQQSAADPGRAPRWRPSAEDISAFGDARIAALKAGLKLTPDQEKNWPALEKALRDRAKQRSERMAARASADRPNNPIERLQTHAEMLTQRGQTLKAIADAAAPLYQSLDESQNHGFMILARLGGRHRGGWRRRGGDDHHAGMPHGRMGPGGVIVPDPMAPGGPGAPPAMPDRPRPQ